MKLVKKAMNTARKMRIRKKGRAQRGKISNTFASFFDSLPRTAEGDIGHEAFTSACVETFDLMECQVVLSWIGQFAATGKKWTIEQCANSPGDDLHRIVQCDAERFGLVIDTDMILALLDRDTPIPSGCQTLCLDLSLRKKGETSPSAIPIYEGLLDAGFDAALRSSPHNEDSFKVLFVRRDVPDATTAKLASVVNAACDPGAELLPIHNKDIPVYVPCFNNQTYCRNMVDQLVALGFEKVTLIDNASTNAEMHQFLDEVEDVVKVDRLSDNLGPKNSVFTPERYAEMPRYFCVTDPDIAFNPFLPKDFIAQLIEQTRIHETPKAGFALNIAHRQFFKDTTVTLLYQDWSIWEWEERYWPDVCGKTRSNDLVYKASVDTTFAVYDKERWVRNNFLEAVRVAGRFTALHTPWYTESDVPASEREAYQREGKYSYYKM